MGLVKLTSGKSVNMPRALLADLALRASEDGLGGEKVRTILETYQYNWSLLDIASMSDGDATTLKEMIVVYLKYKNNYSLEYKWNSIEDILNSIVNDINRKGEQA